VDPHLRPQCLLDMIRFSPHLEVLRINLGTDANRIGIKWSIDDLVQAMDERFTNLRDVEIGKSADVDLIEFAKEKPVAPFRKFLIDHPSIERLFVPPPYQGSSPGPPLHLPHDMLPNLRFFGGTSFWCSQIAELDVAKQLTGVTVVENREADNDDWQILLQAVCRMPSLEELDVSTKEDCVTGDWLRGLALAAPGLKTLAIGYWSNETVSVQESSNRFSF